MLKRINWKSVFKCFAWIVCLGGIVTLMSFVGIKKRSVNCTNIKILIPGADNFIEREEIDAILKQSEGQLIGRKLEGINLHQMEDKIKANPYIAVATIYADMDGVINIEISQRQPLLRIINAGGQDFYIDRNGLKMPVSPNFTANVVVANGHILERFNGKVDTLNTKMAADLYKTAMFLKKDSLWQAQIEQIFVNDKEDIELIPRVGNQRIILGNADSLDVKMGNLRIFYKKAMPQVGWDTYKTINIKYTNQIVCEKSKPDSLHHNSVAGHSEFKPTVAGEKKVMDSIVKAEIASELKNNPGEETDKEVPEKKVSSSAVAAVGAAAAVAVMVHKTEAKKLAAKPVIKPAVKPLHKPLEKKVIEKKIVEKKPAEKKSGEKKSAEKKPIDKKTTEKKALSKEDKADHKLPEKKKRPLEKRSALGDEKADVPAEKPMVKATAKKPEAISKKPETAEKKKEEAAKKEETKTALKKTANKTTVKKTTKFPEIRWIKPIPQKTAARKTEAKKTEAKKTELKKPAPKKVVKPKVVKPEVQPKMVNLHD